MAATVPTTEPTSARAGDTWQWRREDLSSDYPASAWTLKYYFRNASSYFDVTASADGDDFEVTVAKATTAGYTVGDYDWVAVVESATERFEIDAGRLEVTRNYATGAVYDGRTFARTVLEAVEAAILSKATGSQLDLVQAALSERSLQYRPADLFVLRSKLQAEVRREDSARAGIRSNRVSVRFG